MTKKYAQIKVYPNGPFYKEIKNIVTTRRATIDKLLDREISFARLCDAMAKEPEFQFLKNKMLRAPRKEQLK